MDLSSNNYLFSSQGDTTLMSKTSMKNPFLDSFCDPFCNKLNIKETSSDFVGSTTESCRGGISEISAKNGVTKRNNYLLEAPLTPGRPIFSFSNTTTNYSRKSCFPSKWDDAQKWLVSTTGDSPANNNNNTKMYSRQCSEYKPQMGHHEIFAEKSRITEEKVSKVLISTFQGQQPLVMDHHHIHTSSANGVALSAPPLVLLKDKYPNELSPISPNFENSEPMQERFLFGNTARKSISSQEQHDDDDQLVQHRDIGTEMTPLASSTTSRCPTPFKSTSPARHNTPANRSGPLGPSGPDDDHIIDITQLQDCHLAKLQYFGMQFDSVASNWSSREEEEEDVSKSLRHFEITSSECRKSVSESRKNNNCVWEEEEKIKSCLRYQREEAKIEAWVNLQSAKAEAESRKLEVKIQKMRANLEEKLMKRMADVHRKAEEWRATAQFQHSEQVRKAGQQARDRRNNKSNNFSSGHKSCGCFPTL